MQTKLENLNEKCEIRFEVVTEGEEWTNAQQKAVASLAQNVTVKGFRKGKAPLSQAVKLIKPTDILDKAADTIVQKAFKDMLDNHDVKPFLQPEIEVKEFNEKKLSFTFVVVTSPIVTLGDYKGLTVDKKAVRVLKADVEKELTSLQEKNAELVVAELDEEAKNGDTVVIDFKGYVDGKEFEGGDATAFELVLGSNTFVPGFEEQLIGVKTNDDKDVVITFPENYVADLANKEATFKVHVTSIKRKVIPALDEDFVKDLDIDGVDTVEKLKEHLKNTIKERKTKEAEQNQFNTLLEKIIDNASFTCHEKLLKKDADRIVNDFKNRLEQQGFSFDDYLKMTKKSKEDLDAEALVEATKNAKRAYVFDHIALAENIKVSAEEIDAKLEEYAKMYNASVETLKKQLGKNLDSFGYSLLQDKVIEFIKANNNL